MGGAKGKGGKNRKKGTNKTEVAKRDLTTREDGQEYGICTAMLGCNKIKVHLFSGSDVIGVIRGKIVRRMWIALGNVVLCGNREFQSGSPKVDIILRYTWDEVSELQRMGEIPDISRWSLVGRGGVEETEENATGNVKFTSDIPGSKTDAARANDGWEMPSSSGSDDDDDDSSSSGSDDDGSGSEEDPDRALYENEYAKEDHHGRKQTKRKDNRKGGTGVGGSGSGTRGVDDGTRTNTTAGGTSTSAGGAGRTSANYIPPQRMVRSFEEEMGDELDIDDI